MFGKRTPKIGPPILCSVLLAGGGFQAAATTINVDDVSDTLNGSDGKCTLREAVIAANTNTASGIMVGECPAGTAIDTINLQAEIYNLTILGINEDDALTGDLDIRASMTIAGAGPMATLIFGKDNDRVIDVHTAVGSGSVTIRDLELSHGDTNGNGGAVRNRAQLTLRRVTVFKHTGNLGGAIYSDDELELVDCSVDEAIAADDGGGIFLTAGSNTTLTRTSVTGNEAGGTGGGIVSNGTLTMNESSVQLNTGAWGGGIHVESGVLTLSESTIANNTARRYGGGLANEGTANITNSTISTNTAPEWGGNIGNMIGGSVVLLNSTLASGSSPNGTAIRNLGSAQTTNSIFQGNCTGNALVSNGGNLESGGNSCGLNLASDKPSVAFSQIHLRPLSNYGGPTETHALGYGSVAIDVALNGPCPGTDQRGKVRPQDGDENATFICDIGAYEAFPPLFSDGFETGDTSAWTLTFP